MLPKKKIIPLRTSFYRIRRTGQTYDSPSFGLIVSYDKQRKQSEEARLGFVVSKKVDKRAVIRNRIKRKFSEAVLPFTPRLAKQLELVFLIKSKAIGSSLQELNQEMNSLFARIKLL